MAKKRKGGTLVSIRKAIQREKDRIKAEGLRAELAALKKKKGTRKAKPKKKAVKKRKRRHY